MKKLLVSAVLMMMFVLGVNAEEQQKFSPEKFQADLDSRLRQMRLQVSEPSSAATSMRLS